MDNDRQKMQVIGMQGVKYYFQVRIGYSGNEELKN